MTTTKKKKRSAAASVLGEKGSVSSLVLGAQESSPVTPDKEIKSSSVRARVKKIVSVRKSISVKSSAAARAPALRERIHKAQAHRGVVSDISFNIGAFFGMIKRLGRLGLEKI